MLKISSHRSAFSLLELMVSQAIALIVIAGLLALFVPLVQNFAQTEGGLESQVHLREASHVILRDVQGLGGADGGTGSLFAVLQDGGATGPDRFRVFRRDHTICTENLAEPGVMALSAINAGAKSVTLGNVAGVCPLTSATCTPAMVTGRKLLVRSANVPSLPLVVTAADAATCTITFAAGSNTGATAEYNAVFNTSLAAYDDVFTALAAAGSSQPVIVVGSSFEYRIDTVNGRLQRSVNGGAFTDILDGVFDIQVVPTYDLNKDGDVEDANEVDLNNSSTASPTSFFGAKISIVTFAGAKNGMAIAPPSTIANRNLGTAPGNRRYAASTVFIAARNP